MGLAGARDAGAGVTYRPAFREALSLLAVAFERLAERGIKPPVLVGGAAVELLTGGALISGDFDLVTPAQTELFEELRTIGFIHPGGNFLARSLLHPASGIGVQCVSGLLMDGATDLSRIQVVQVDGGQSISVIPREDLIADRMGQALSRPLGGILEDMKDQAAKLYLLADDLDSAYLDKRIQEETSGAANLTTLKAWTDEVRHA